MTDPHTGPDSGGSLPDQRRPTPGESGPGLVRRGSFGAEGSGDTSGFGGLVRRPWAPAPAERPFGGYLDELTDIVAEVYPAFGQAVTKIVVDRGELTFEVAREHLVDLCRTLRDDPALRFELCVSVSGIDYLGAPDRLHSVVHLTSMTYRRKLRLETAVSVADPHIPSIVDIYPTADWQERESWDMFGIVYDGHPGLTRILMPDDWDGHPQRKDYPLGGVNVQYKGATIPPPDERRNYS